MTKYRILEKEGIYRSPQEIAREKGQRNYLVYTNQRVVYIPRFIVQEGTFTEETYSSDYETMIPTKFDYIDLKEFTSLKEAREYKRSLELKEGIVIE